MEEEQTETKSAQVSPERREYAQAGKANVRQETPSQNRLAQIGIIVENRGAVRELNLLLGAFGRYIVGRMGLPVEKRGVSVISVVVDAPADEINALTGRLGALAGVTAKTLYAKL